MIRCINVHSKEMETVRDNVLKMLERRGYDVTVIQETPTHFRICGVLVVVVDDCKVSVGTMKSIVNMRSTNEKIIVIHTYQLTAEAKNVMNGADDIETFTKDEMSFDLLDAIPLHSRVDGPKKPDWKHFPVLLSTDRASRYFGFKKGNIVRIVEDDGTLSYRRVV